MRFLPIRFDRIEIEQWGWIQYVSLAKAYQMICSMTYRGHHVTSCDLELRLSLTKSLKDAETILRSSEALASPAQVSVVEPSGKDSGLPSTNFRDW